MVLWSRMGKTDTLYKCLENPVRIIFLLFEIIQSEKTVLLSLEVMVISYTPSVAIGKMICFFCWLGNMVFLVNLSQWIVYLKVFLVNPAKNLVNAAFFRVGKLEQVDVFHEFFFVWSTHRDLVFFDVDVTVLEWFDFRNVDDIRPVYPNEIVRR